MHCTGPLSCFAEQLPIPFFQVVLEFFVKRSRVMGDRLVHSYRYRKQLKNLSSTSSRSSHGSHGPKRDEGSSKKDLSSTPSRSSHGSHRPKKDEGSSKRDKDKSPERIVIESESDDELAPPGVETFDTDSLSASNKLGMGSCSFHCYTLL